MRFALLVLLFACGFELEQPGEPLQAEGVAPVVVKDPPICPCGLEGTWEHLDGQAVICAPICTATGNTPLAPSIPYCTATLGRDFNACVTVGCCHWHTPAELGL